MSQRKPRKSQQDLANYGATDDDYPDDEGNYLLSGVENPPRRMQFLNIQAGQYEPDTEYAPSDGEYHSHHSTSVEDFGDVKHQKGTTMTGRQRKKLAARSKGGEFQVYC